MGLSFRYVGSKEPTLFQKRKFSRREVEQEVKV